MSINNHKRIIRSLGETFTISIKSDKENPPTLVTLEVQPSCSCRDCYYQNTFSKKAKPCSPYEAGECSIGERPDEESVIFREISKLTFNN